MSIGPLSGSGSLPYPLVSKVGGGAATVQTPAESREEDLKACNPSGKATDPLAPQGVSENSGNASPIDEEDQGSGLDLAAKDQEAKALFDLTLEEQKQVQQLRQRDREVRAHEQAHLAAGGRYVRGGAHFQYTTGPDNRPYATGGEVAIDSGPESDPLATMQKARTVKRAALAPAQPSAQDRQVAAQASQMEAEARTEWSQQKADEAEPAAARTRESKKSPEDGEQPYSESRYGKSRPPPTAVPGVKRLKAYV